MRKMIIKTVYILSALMLMALFSCACQKEKDASSVSKENFVLDTICRIEIYDMEEMSEESAGKVLDSAFDELGRYERLLSRTEKGSDVYRINHAGGKPVTCDPETVSLIKKGREFGKYTGGRFDITVGRITDLWEFHEGEEGYGTPPDKNEADKAAASTDYRKIKVDGRKISLGDKDAMLDLGGIAKGWISGKLCEYLESKGVTSAVISLGGNVACIGGKPDNDGTTEFRIGIRDPESARSDKGADYADIVNVRDKSVITSGTYERYFEYKGTVYHHILDPDTGMPADTGGLTSVTAIGRNGDGAELDACATSILLMAGSEQYEGLVKKFQKKIPGLGIILVTDEGKVIKYGV